jgi:hypothetical protein
MGDRNPGCELGENGNGMQYVVFHFKSRKLLGYGRNYLFELIYIRTAVTAVTGIYLWAKYVHAC